MGTCRLIPGCRWVRIGQPDLEDIDAAVANAGAAPEIDAVITHKYGLEESATALAVAADSRGSATVLVCMQ